MEKFKNLNENQQDVSNLMDVYEEHIEYERDQDIIWAVHDFLNKTASGGRPNKEKAYAAVDKKLKDKEADFAKGIIDINIEITQEEILDLLVDEIAAKLEQAWTAKNGEGIEGVDGAIVEIARKVVDEVLMISPGV